jgi:hypothetical protein
MTKYARDEFDRVPETSTRQGVHRAASTSRRRSLAPILAAGLAALAVGLVAFLILPKLGFAAAGESSAVTAEAGASASPSPTATGPTAASASPGASASAAGEAPAGAPSASAPAGDTPSVTVPSLDKTQPVTIYNATTTAGLAGRVGGTVSSAGWTLGPLGNWSGVRQQSSVIFYGGEAQQGNAEALGRLLGIPTIVPSAEFKVPLVVVLGPGFQ